MDTNFPHSFGAEARTFWGTQEALPPGLDGQHKTFARLENLDREQRRFLDALYDGSLRHADREIGRLVSFLERAGLARDTLIAVTSDHGEHLVETPGRFAHGGAWLDPVSHIPMIFHQPSRLEAQTVPGFSGLVDVAPTMLGLLGVSVPPGRSMSTHRANREGSGLTPLSMEA
jgi:arylsulfatase A-like enzyme